MFISLIRTIQLKKLCGKSTLQRCSKRTKHTTFGDKLSDFINFVTQILLYIQRVGTRCGLANCDDNGLTNMSPLKVQNC